MNYYFQHDTTSNVLYPYLQSEAPESSAQVEVLGPYPQDSASADIVAAYQYPNRYTVVSGAITLLPFFTFNSSIANNEYTVTATLHNPPATPPTSCEFNLMGQSFTEQLTNNIATFIFDIHPALVTDQINIGVSAAGCASGTLTIGSAPSSFATQVFIQANGIPKVAPTGAGSKAFLVKYWTSLVSPSNTIADIATIDGINTHTLYSLIIPGLVSHGIITLDANQANALSDIQTNVLPSIQATLENVAPVPVSGQPQAYDLHYASYSRHIVQMAQSMQGYIGDLSTIPNLA